MIVFCGIFQHLISELFLLNTYPSNTTSGFVKMVASARRWTQILTAEHSLVVYRCIQNDETIQKMYMSILAGIENLDINAKTRIRKFWGRVHSEANKI